MLAVVRRLYLILAVDRPSLADEKNDCSTVPGQECDMISTPVAKGVAAVNFLQLYIGHYFHKYLLAPTDNSLAANVLDWNMIHTNAPGGHGCS